MESFSVKFWIINSKGFGEQIIERVLQNSKLHKKAQEFIMKKYNISKKDIVSVTYE